MNEKRDERVVAQGRYIDNGYYAPEICQLCHQMKAEGKGGPKCCEHMACIYSPLDFEVLRNDKYTHEQRVWVLTELLKCGNMAIDMCCYKDRTYGPLHYMTLRPDIDKMSDGDGYLFLRARSAGRGVIDFQYFMEEADYPCMHWDPENGCRLSKEERPAGGRLLRPILKERCGVRFCACEQVGEEDILNHWAKHQLLMYDVYLAVRDLDIK